MTRLARSLQGATRLLPRAPARLDDLGRGAAAAALGFLALHVLFFSPVLFSGRLLAPEDGLRYHLPHVLSRPTLWTDLLFGGFPVAADVQVQTWYPLARLFGLVPQGWNLYVISAFTLASAFAYGYVSMLTRSRLAGFVTGATYALGGFAVAHLNHVAILHSLPWIALLIWSLHGLRTTRDRRWLAGATVAIALLALGGHPQIAAYGGVLAASYATFLLLLPQPGRRRFLLHAVAAVLLGLGLGAIQLLPTAELAAHGQRGRLSFAEFTSYSVPPEHLPTLLFPYAFGGGPRSWGGAEYFGAWNFHELVVYVGLLPPLLAAMALLATRRRGPPRDPYRALVLFWVCAGLVGLLLALEVNPLASLLYHTPLNRFRALGRFSVIWTLSTAVAAGLGVHAVLSSRVRTREAIAVTVAAAAILVVILVGLIAVEDQLATRAHTVFPGDDLRPRMAPWANPATALPLLIFGLGTATLLVWLRRPHQPARQAALVGALVLDLASFGWVAPWRRDAPRADVVHPTRDAVRYRDLLSARHQRLLSVRGHDGALAELPVNLTRLWGVPSAGGYAPLRLGRLAELAAVGPEGLAGPAALNVNRALDIMAVRYVVAPGPEAPWPHGTGAPPVDLTLGSGCSAPPADSVVLAVPPGVRASTLVLVTSLACSVEISDRAPVVEVEVRPVHGAGEVHRLLAGRDTAEWSYDCADVRPHVRHARAPVHESFRVERGEVACEAHRYRSAIELALRDEVRGVMLRWVGGETAAISLRELRLENGRSPQGYLVNALTAVVLDTEAWDLVEANPDVMVYENHRAFPRAWLVEEVVQADRHDVLAAIRASRLPGGRSFDPGTTALVEEPVAFEPAGHDPDRRVDVVERREAGLTLRTTSRAPSFLITSDVDYPGWRATIDGVLAPIHTTDYVLRGVTLPAGEHLVRFTFQPRSFHRGAGLTLAAAVILVLVLVLPARRE